MKKIIGVLRQALKDILEGKYLEYYIPIVLAIIVVILDVFNPVSEDNLKEITLLFLAALAAFLLSIQKSFETINEKNLSLQFLSQLTPLQQMLGYLWNGQYKHKEVLSQLITTALSDERLHSIPWMDDGEYLNLLRIAIAKSDDFQAIQDKPISWYEKQENDEGGSYLRSIKNKEMKQKRRIFFIRDADQDQMRKDLKSEQAMRYYWDNTGAAMDTYYIFEENFKIEYPQLNSPRDCVVFDNVLYIEYFSSVRTVKFKMLDYGSSEAEIFKCLDRKCLDRGLEEGNLYPFVKISPPPSALAGENNPIRRITNR